MGVSGSSLLDETKSASIQGEAEAELSRFAPFFRKQFSVARFAQAQNDLEQHQETSAGLLRQKAPPEGAEVLYEDAVLYFDESRKWRDRYVVVRANYSLELHDGLESFLKGVPARHRLLPTGGAVLTTEERYMQMVDRCFPDDGGVKEEFAPPLASMPGQFPVYLRLPYRRDSYFCFKQQLRQEAFISFLWDCIRHQNQDFLKKSSCEVKAFLKAVQFFRESQGKYSSWDMLIGSDTRVLSNAVMERLLPTLEKELLPKLKAKKTEKKRVWFATVEAAYIAVQERLLEKLSQLKDECRTSLRQQEVLIHSDMDQILRSRDTLQEKVQAVVVSPAQLLVSEKVRPFLPDLLEDLMEPISLSFTQSRELCAGLMEEVSAERLQQPEELQKALLSLSRPRLFDCFRTMASLEQRPQIRDRFGFNNIRAIVHRAQIDLQQLMGNASFTFETLVKKALEENPEAAAAAVEKIRLRVLRYFDYDSSSMRTRIFEDALTQITLPFMKEQLQDVRTQLRDAAEHVLLDHCDFIDVDNVYEDVLLSVLHQDVSTVLKDASRLQKYNLLNDSRDVLSRSSLSSVGSAPASPALSPVPTNHSPTTPHTPKTPTLNGDANLATAQTNTSVIQAQVENTSQERAANGLQDATVEASSGASEQTENETQDQTDAGKEEDQERGSGADDVNKTAGNGQKVEEAAKVNSEEAEEKTLEIHDEVFEVNEEKMKMEGVQEETVPKVETASATNEDKSPDSEENVQNEAEVKAQAEDKMAATDDTENKMAPINDTENKMVATDNTENKMAAVVEAVGAEEVTTGEVSVKTEGEVEAEAPSGGEAEETEAVKEEEEEDSDDEGSTTSDVLEENIQSPLSSEESQSEQSGRAAQETRERPLEAAAEERPPEAAAEERPPEAAAEGAERPPEAAAEAGEAERPPEAAAEAGEAERPQDCIKAIRELVEEVIEVEELVQRYPSGVPTDLQSPDQDQD